MWIVKLALRRPYTFVVMAILMLVLGVTAIVSMPTGIFPYINIPVVSVVWAYSGMSPQEMAVPTSLAELSAIAPSSSGISITGASGFSAGPSVP